MSYCTAQIQLGSYTLKGYPELCSIDTILYLQVMRPLRGARNATMLASRTDSPNVDRYIVDEIYGDAQSNSAEVALEPSAQVALEPTDAQVAVEPPEAQSAPTISTNLNESSGQSEVAQETKDESKPQPLN